MARGLIDITTPHFWFVVLIAALLMAPVTQNRVRRVLFCGVNLGFLWMVLDIWIAPVLFGLITLRFALQAISKGRAPRATVIGAVAVATVFFVLHKLPQFATHLGAASVNPLLATIGFSYVFLRLLELYRSVWETEASPDLVAMINYLLPFHMLPAGPIQAYNEFVAADHVPEKLSPRNVLEAIERIAQGLFKKFVLAYILRRLFLSDFQSEGLLWVVEVQIFFLWLYLDFSAYSDIAVGIGRLIGVTTPENFNRPYLARNVIDFWERWHISLSEFIRRNLFVPIQLTMMRRRRWSPLVCANVAVAVSFISCGLWHGIGVNFLLWGAVHCVGLMAVNVYRHLLTKWMGAKRIKTYMADKRIRAVSTLATYQFVAASLLTLFL